VFIPQLFGNMSVFSSGEQGVGSYCFWPVWNSYPLYFPVTATSPLKCVHQIRILPPTYFQLNTEVDSVWKRCGINKERQRTASNILIKLIAIYRRQKHSRLKIIKVLKPRGRSEWILQQVTGN